MFWLATTVTVGVVALLAARFARRSAGAAELGVVSDRWVAEHRADSGWVSDAGPAAARRAGRRPIERRCWDEAIRFPTLVQTKLSTRF
jgi:hypothetical protein